MEIVAEHLKQVHNVTRQDSFHQRSVALEAAAVPSADAGLRHRLPRATSMRTATYP
jgi:hypothetical protein